MATLHVRSIEDQLYEALGRKAARDNRSISQEVIVILKEHLSQPVPYKSATENFMELCGTWKDEKSAKEISQNIRKSRRSKTRLTHLLIGATGITMGYSIVTNNEKHFKKIPGLSIENWTKS